MRGSPDQGKEGSILKVVLPFRGEMGQKIQWHAPAVHAIAGPKVVYIEEGEQALYPSATEHREVERNHDDRRRNRYERDAQFVRAVEMVARAKYPNAEILRPGEDWPRKRFIPQRHVRQGVSADVVVCPRRRNYGAGKNWPHWVSLTERLVAEGLNVFAGGAADSSFDVPCPKAWDYERNLDATIEAMHSARLVVATEAGLGPLAVLCGRPLLIITHADGLVAPGYQVDEMGRVFRHKDGRPKEYDAIRMDRHNEANHTGSPIELVKHAWDDPGKVFAETMGMCAARGFAEGLLADPAGFAQGIAEAAARGAAEAINKARSDG